LLILFFIVKNIFNFDTKIFWDVVPPTAFGDVTQWEFSHYRYLLSRAELHIIIFIFFLYYTLFSSSQTKTLLFGLLASAPEKRRKMNNNKKIVRQQATFFHPFFLLSISLFTLFYLCWTEASAKVRTHTTTRHFTRESDREDFHDRALSWAALSIIFLFIIYTHFHHKQNILAFLSFAARNLHVYYVLNGEVHKRPIQREINIFFI
jgi:hypothetical protein